MLLTLRSQPNLNGDMSGSTSASICFEISRPSCVQTRGSCWSDHARDGQTHHGVRSGNREMRVQLRSLC